MAWARTVGGCGVQSWGGGEGTVGSEREARDGESYICHYRDLGFYSKLGNHQALNRRVTGFIF